MNNFRYLFILAQLVILALIGTLGCGKRSESAAPAPTPVTTPTVPLPVSEVWEKVQDFAKKGGTSAITLDAVKKQIDGLLGQKNGNDYALALSEMSSDDKNLFQILLDTNSPPYTNVAPVIEEISGKITNSEKRREFLDKLNPATQKKPLATIFDNISAAGPTQGDKKLLVLMAKNRVDTNQLDDGALISYFKFGVLPTNNKEDIVAALSNLPIARLRELNDTLAKSHENQALKDAVTELSLTGPAAHKEWALKLSPELEKVR